MAEVKTTSRSSRASEGRVHESRYSEEDMRPRTGFQTGSCFNIPEEILKGDPEHYYCAVPYTSGGKDLREEYDEAVYQQGFMPVKRSSHPLLKRNLVESPFGRSEDDDLVKIRGHIVMKCRVDVKKERDAQNDERLSRQNAIRDMHRSDHMGVTRVLNDDRKYGN